MLATAMIKLTLEKRVVRKTFISRVLTIEPSERPLLSFNSRAVPWAFRLEFVCKSRTESRGTTCLQNKWLTERKPRPVSEELIFSLIVRTESSDKKHNRFYMSQSGLKEPGQINVSKNGERFQRKLENLKNDYAFKNLRLSTFPNHELMRKFKNHRR